MNCATNAFTLATNSFSDQLFAYLNTVTKKVLYSSNSYFTNPNSALCGAFSTCELKASGCLTSYTPGELTITSGTGKIEATQNKDPGYVETVCVKCTNTGG